MITEMYACSACAELMRLLKVAEAFTATRADPDPASSFSELVRAIAEVRAAMTKQMDTVE